MLSPKETARLVCVTGATGFLGRHLVRQLLEGGYRLRLLVRENSDTQWLQHSRYANWWKEIELVTGDITESASVQRAVQGCRQVVHAAGRFRFWGPMEKFAQVNIHGTETVARAAAQAGVQRFVHISSLAVIGHPPPGETIDESTPCQPVDPYQCSKLEAEALVRRLVRTRNLPAVILRPGAFYGPGSTYGFNRLFILDPLKGLRIQVNHGQNIIFPVFIRDVAQAITLTLKKNWSGAGPQGEIYNISDQSVTHASVNRLVSELAGISAWRLNVPDWVMIQVARLLEARARQNGKEPFYPLNLRHYVFQDWKVSHEKARRELGFEPTPLKPGLESTLAWCNEMGLIRTKR
ncbi:MAG: SDR family NAD(P)-dependent oxidoreductase [Anaerolineales bacterium]